jgi:flagellin-like hook-associated protein FlgL
VYYYNHEGQSEVSAAALQTPSYLAGLYHQQSGSTLQDLINSVNQGTASRVQMNFQDDRISALSLANSAQLNIYLGDEVYQFGSGAANSALVDGQPPTHYIDVTTLAGGDRISDVLGSAVSNQAGGRFSTLASSGRLFVFTRVGGDYDHLSAKDCGVRASAAEQNVTWTNAETWQDHDCSASFGLGGESWARAGYIEHDNRYFFKLEGQGLGDHFDLHIGNASAYTGLNNISAFAAADFVERQDASEGDWAGAHLRTQSHAQEALEAIERAMYRKDNTRADLGAYQNRLSNTVDNLGIMVEELQKSESRISDVDVARETTEYSRNSILAQAGTSMLAQANSLPEMALTLLG